MFFHQETNILINSIDDIEDTMNLKTISNIQISAHCIVTIPTTVTGKCIATTLCILEVEIDEVISI